MASAARFTIRPEDGWVAVTSADVSFIRIRSNGNWHGFYVECATSLPANTVQGFKCNSDGDTDDDFWAYGGTNLRYYVRTYQSLPEGTVIDVFTLAAGTAGTPAGGVQSIQGVPLGTPVPVEQPIFNVVATAMTRPNDTTAYAAGDSISDNTTAGSVTANVVALSDINDAPVAINEIELDSTSTGLSGVQVRLYLYSADPTASSGVVGGDNAAFSNKRGGFRRSFIGTFLPFSDGARAILVPEIGGVPQGGVALVSPATGTKNFWWQLQTLSVFTPTAQSTWTSRFKGWQGRLAA